MMKGKISPEEIKRMQTDPEMLRNICILAHVDHGKTTLSDSLISSNQIINQKLAGKLKYLDSRDDEQQRMITMKASSITLFHQKVQRISKEQREAGVEPKSKLYKINLMDSPGHVDFTNEVSSALRLSDGALVLIDVIEGVSPQSLTVLRQAWDEKVRTCLVLNKLDRLIVERNMDAEDIYQHCQNIIEQVNAIISSFISETNMQHYIKSTGEQKEGDSDEDSEEILNDETRFFYSPEKGNVAFTSAVSGWGFTVPAFAYLIAKKFNIQPKKLSRFLWGNYYFANNKITKKAPTKNSKPLFVQYVLAPLVSEYTKAIEPVEETDSKAVSKACEKVSETLRKRIPLDKNVFNMIVNKLPSPKFQQKERLEIFSPELANLSEESRAPEEYNQLVKIKEGIETCDNGEEAPVVIYISKMQPIDSKSYAMAAKAQEFDSETKKLIGFGRVFSGKLVKGKEMYVFGVKHSKESPDVTKCTIDDIFILMGGNNLKLVNDMNAGNIVGIGGLENVLLKMGTISSLPECPSFAPAKLLGTGLIKVAIQPKNLSDMPILVEGLRKLDKADPSVSYYLNEKGEYILQTCGQIHLERCIKDLNDDFAQIEIEISPPIITFKETITMKNLRRESDIDTGDKNGEWFERNDEEIEKLAQEAALKTVKRTGRKRHEDSSDEEEKEEGEGSESEEELKFIYEEEKQDQTDMYIERVMNMKNLKTRDALKKMRGFTIGETPNRKCKVRIRTVGLPFELTKWLEKHDKEVSLLYHLVTTWSKQGQGTIEDELKRANDFVNEFLEKLNDFEVPNRLIDLIKRYLICFGPKRNGPNMLINQLIDEKDCLLKKFEATKQHFCFEEEKKVESDTAEASSPTDEPQEEASKKLNHYQRKRLRKQRKLDAVKTWFKLNDKEIMSSITAGFEYACSHGPLFGETILGSCFIIDEIEVIDESARDFLLKQKKQFESGSADPEPSPSEEKEQDEEEEKIETKVAQKSAGNYQDTYGPMTGQIMSLISKLCKKGFLNAEPRIVEGMYKCELQVSSENLGKIYAVIGKHRAKTLEEELQENSEMFLLKILVPVYESFKFSDQIRDRECGIPHPQLVFYGWEVNEMDPFHVNMTDDEIEEFGDQELPPNQVKMIIDEIRKRKGLAIEKKLVEDGGKQVTLSKKK